MARFGRQCSVAAEKTHFRRDSALRGWRATKKSSNCASQSRTPPVMPARLDTIVTSRGNYSVILTALPPPR